MKYPPEATAVVIVDMIEVFLGLWREVELIISVLWHEAHRHPNTRHTRERVVLDVATGSCQECSDLRFVPTYGCMYIEQAPLD